MSQRAGVASVTCDLSSSFRSDTVSPVSIDSRRLRAVPGPSRALQSAKRSATTASTGATYTTRSWAGGGGE